MNRKLEADCASARAIHGDKFDPSEIEAVSPRIRDHYRGERVIIENAKHGHRRAGVVSKTNGWKPALLLVHRSTDAGSWDVISPDDVLVAVKRGNRYINPRTGKQEKVTA